MTEMNGADLVACGIIATLALWLLLWSLLTWTPRALNRGLSRLARWHARQVIRANTPIRWEDRK